MTSPGSKLELPLFPLHSVLFPGVALPLHIFEERYRQMVARCVDRGEPFGVVLIRDGREVGGGTLSLADVGTTAIIRRAGRYADGNWTSSRLAAGASESAASTRSASPTWSATWRSWRSPSASASRPAGWEPASAAVSFATWTSSHRRWPSGDGPEVELEVEIDLDDDPDAEDDDDAEGLTGAFAVLTTDDPAFDGGAPTAARCGGVVRSGTPSAAAGGRSPPHLHERPDRVVVRDHRPGAG